MAYRVQTHTKKMLTAKSFWSVLNVSLFLVLAHWKKRKSGHELLNYSKHVHARLLPAAPSPAPGEGRRAQAHIATQGETCVPGQSHCQAAAANQKAPPQDWTICPPAPHTGTPGPGARRGEETLYHTFRFLSVFEMIDFFPLPEQQQRHVGANDSDCASLTCCSRDR